MARIIHFKSKKEKMKEWISEILNTEVDENDSVAVLINKKKDIVLTAYYNSDLMDKINLKNHFAMDIIDSFIKVNINNYIEYVEQ